MQEQLAIIQGRLLPIRLRTPRQQPAHAQAHSRGDTGRASGELHSGNVQTHLVHRRAPSKGVLPGVQEGNQQDLLDPEPGLLQMHCMLCQGIAHCRDLPGGEET